MKRDLWYGIKDVEFIPHGEWADAEIRYKGVTLNSTIVEDTMCERFREDFPNEVEYGEKFEQYMLDNADEVYYLIDLAVESYGGDFPSYEAAAFAEKWQNDGYRFVEDNDGEFCCVEIYHRANSVWLQAEFHWLEFDVEDFSKSTTEVFEDFKKEFNKTLLND